MQFKLIIILLVALVLILVTVQNPNPVAVQFVGWTATGVPLIVIILVSFMAGIIVSSILGLVKQAKLRDKLHALRQELDAYKYSALTGEEKDIK